jgi:hypothetical protein
MSNVNFETPVGVAALPVFVSYAWDNDEHKEWVFKFVNRLRQNGIDAFIDQTHLPLGARSPEFMERSVRDSGRVLVICTENYKTRFDNRRGGAGYEGHIITGEIVNEVGKNKFIPVLRSGDWKTALPTALLGVQGVDLRKDSLSEFRKLIGDLHGVSHVLPLGPRPAWLGEKPESLHGVISTPSQPEFNDTEYWKQRKNLPDTELITKIWSRPRWRIWIRPTQFKKARFQSVEQCREFMLSSYVKVWSWYPYPYFSVDQLETGDEWVAGEIEHSDGRMTRMERWTLYRSGQFVHNRSFDQIEGIGSRVHVLEILDTVTAAFEFAARLADQGFLSGEAAITVELFGIDGRELTWPRDRFGERDAIGQRYWCQDETVTLTKMVPAEELKGKRRELALDAILEIYSYFGWRDVPREQLIQEQNKRIGV